jgi:hypothetical protein
MCEHLILDGATTLAIRLNPRPYGCYDGAMVAMEVFHKKGDSLYRGDTLEKNYHRIDTGNRLNTETQRRGENEMEA